MTSSSRTRLDQVEDCLATAFHAAIAIACAAFGVMLLAPDELTESMLAVAWVSMGSAAVCLVGRFLVGLLDDHLGASPDLMR